MKKHGFQQLVEIELVLRRHFDVEHFTAHGFDEHLVLEQLLAHFFRVGLMLVDLVDRHDDRHIGRLGVVDRLDRLRHDAVIGGNHQNGNVGRLSATSTHGREGGVAGVSMKVILWPFCST